MCKDVHDHNGKIMISVWPNTSGGESHRELWEKDHLLGDGEVYNVFNQDACETYWNQVKVMTEHGFDAWWCDCREPYEEGWGTKIQDDELKTKLVANYKQFMDSRYINLFSLLHCRNLYTRQMRDYGDKRMVNLTRSGYAGQQRYSGIVWSGDISASWTDLRNQVVEGLNFCASGLPYWTLDIGGFFPKYTPNELRVNMRCDATSVEDPFYQELYTRWLEFGTFLPMFRSHGHLFPREIWQFGDEGGMFYDSIKKFIELRYTLIPYIYSTAWQVTSNAYTFLRMLAFDFADDKRACGISDQFMFGPSILVCPVLKPMYYNEENEDITDAARTRNVYLPAGTDWYDF
jgi:alpha-D-xyloside xylohydrolase